MTKSVDLRGCLLNPAVRAAVASVAEMVAGIKIDGHFDGTSDEVHGPVPAGPGAGHQ